MTTTDIISSEPVAPGVESVLRRRPTPHVEWVEVDGEIVAWNQDAESLHLLDQIASLIFQLCDGVTQLSETVLDLADVFGRNADLVEADVLSCAASLLANGLVEDVR